jgi:N-acetylglutamate synthase-like GNAT family acetyltransferase
VNSGSDSISNNAIITSVLISQTQRNNGYGSVMMDLIEKESLKQGYCYLYLYTNTAMKFYEKLGYLSCDKLSSDVNVFQTLDTSFLHSIDKILQRKFSSDHFQADKVNWYRKRLFY